MNPLCGFTGRSEGLDSQGSHPYLRTPPATEVRDTCNTRLVTAKQQTPTPERWTWAMTLQWGPGKCSSHQRFWPLEGARWDCLMWYYLLLGCGVGNRKTLQVLENSGWVSVIWPKRGISGGYGSGREGKRRGCRRRAAIHTAALYVSQINSLVIFQIRFIGTPSNLHTAVA